MPTWTGSIRSASGNDAPFTPFSERPAHAEARAIVEDLSRRRNRDHGAPRNLARDRPGRFPRHHGPVGLRQVDPAEHSGPARQPERRRVLVPRPGSLALARAQADPAPAP